jgi:hypothetical protein
LGEELSTSEDDGIRVELNHGTKVGKRVLLLLRAVGLAILLGADDGLNFIGVDDTGDVTNGDHGSGERISLLDGTLGGSVSEDGVKGLESLLSPDHETTNVTTGGKVKKVEALNGGKLNTGKVAESLLHGSTLLVHDKRTTSHGESSVSHLTGTSSDVLGVLGLVAVIRGTEGLEDSIGILSLGNSLDLVGDDEGELKDVVNLVSTSHNEGREGRGSKGRGNSMTSLSQVIESVPSSPGLGGGKHTTLSALVSEGSLTRSGGSSTGNTRNTGNGTTSTPRLGRVLVTSILSDGISLSVVLGHVLVGNADHISSDGGSKNGSKGDLGYLGGLSSDGVYVNKRTSRLYIYIYTEREGEDGGKR